MQPNLLLHPNFIALQSKLSLPRYAVVGLLELLWQIGAEHAQDGCLKEFTAESLAMTLGWEHSPDELVAALVATRWLDQSECADLSIHNWLVHAPARIRTKLKKQQALVAAQLPYQSEHNLEHNESAPDAFRSSEDSVPGIRPRFSDEKPQGPSGKSSVHNPSASDQSPYPSPYAATIPPVPNVESAAEMHRWLLQMKQNLQRSPDSLFP